MKRSKLSKKRCNFSSTTFQCGPDGSFRFWPHIAINSFGASHQIKMFAMARVEHKGPPMPFMGPLGGPEYAAANPINLHCHCALAYPG